MTCYALACKQEQPCDTPKSCERVWHLCTLPDQSIATHFQCSTCRAAWTLHIDRGWTREPLTRTLTGV